MYTKIFDSTWKSLKRKSVSDDGKLLFIYLFSCSHRNLIGYFYIPKAYMTADLDWSIERVSKGLKELEKEGLIAYDSDNEVVFLAGFLEHNPLDNKNVEKSAVDVFNKSVELWESPLVRQFLTVLKGLPKRFANLIETVAQTVSNTETEEVTEEETETEEEISSSKDEEAEEEKPFTPFKEIMDGYNEQCGELFSELKAMNGKRRESVKARFDDFGMSGFEDAFREMCSSRFLQGENERGWKADFDWLILPTNFQKVIEGRYRDRDTPDDLPELWDKDEEGRVWNGERYVWA